MTRKQQTKKTGWKSLEAEAKRLKGRLKKIEKLRGILPEDVLKDAKAVMEWLRRRHKPKGRQ